MMICKIDPSQREPFVILINSLSNEQPPCANAHAAAIRLRSLGKQAVPAIPALLKAAGTTNVVFWPGVITTLEKITTSSNSLMPILRQKLSLNDEKNHFEAARAILQILPSDHEAQSVLAYQIKKFIPIPEEDAMIALEDAA